MFVLKILSRGLLVILCFSPSTFIGQISYVGNPSFEENCTQNWVKYWPGLDSLTCSFGVLASSCPNNGLAPMSSMTYQVARTGAGYLVTTLFCPTCPNRYYVMNRLLSILVKDQTYCVRFYINVTNKSSLGIDGLQAYFGSKLLDTITVCPTSAMNVTPQISNPFGNIITDTLNWVPVQGTFTAVGDEVYMVIGNFKSDAATNTVVINQTYLPLAFTDVCIDDVSCVPIDLPADAGPNKAFFGGDSVFIGRTPNVGIDYACTWFQLPNMATPIATVAGLWVKPVVTTTYVVRQQLWCSGVQYDTVVVYKDAVGINELKIKNEELKISPNPVASQLDIQFTQQSIGSSIKQVVVVNNLGQRPDVPIKAVKEGHLQIDCTNLSAGVYHLRFELKSGGSFVKKFVVER